MYTFNNISMNQEVGREILGQPQLDIRKGVLVERIRIVHQYTFDERNYREEYWLQVYTVLENKEDKK